MPVEYAQNAHKNPLGLTAVIRCALTKHIDTDSRRTPPAAHRILSLLISFIAHHLNGSHRSSMMTMMLLFVHMMFQLHQTYGLNAFSNICPFFDPFYSSNTFLLASNTKNCSEMCDGMSHHWLKQKKIIKKHDFCHFFLIEWCVWIKITIWFARCHVFCSFFYFLFFVPFWRERSVPKNQYRPVLCTTMLYCINTCILFFPIPHATFQCLTINITIYCAFGNRYWVYRVGVRNACSAAYCCAF